MAVVWEAETSRKTTVLDDAAKRCNRQHYRSARPPGDCESEDAQEARRERRECGRSGHRSKPVPPGHSNPPAIRNRPGPFHRDRFPRLVSSESPGWRKDCPRRQKKSNWRSKERESRGWKKVEASNRHSNVGGMVRSRAGLRICRCPEKFRRTLYIKAMGQTILVSAKGREMVRSRDRMIRSRDGTKRAENAWQVQSLFAVHLREVGSYIRRWQWLRTDYGALGSYSASRFCSPGALWQGPDVRSSEVVRQRTPWVDSSMPT